MENSKFLLRGEIWHFLLSIPYKIKPLWVEIILFASDFPAHYFTTVKCKYFNQWQHNNVDCRAVLWLVERLAEGRYIHSTVVWRCTREPKKSKWSQLYFHDCKEIITTVKTVRKKAQLIFQVRRQGPIHQMCCKKVSMLHVVSCCFLVVFYTFLNALIWIFFAGLTYP